MAEYVLVDGVEFVLVDGAYRPRAGVEATDCPGPFPYLVPFEGNVSAIGFIACSFLNAILFARRSRATRLLLLGAACIIVVVLTHVAEALQVFAIMGWGQSDSAGHYVDLASAIVGCTLLVAGLVVAVLDHRKNVRHKR